MGLVDKLTDVIYNKIHKEEVEITKQEKFFGVSTSGDIVVKNRPLYVYRVQPFMLAGISKDNLITTFNRVWEFLNSINLRSDESMRLLVVQEKVDTHILARYFDARNLEHMNPILTEVNEAILAKAKMNAEKMIRTFYLVSNSSHFQNLNAPSWLEKLDSDQYEKMVNMVYGLELTLKKPAQKQKRNNKTLIANDQHLVMYAINRFPSFKSQYYMGEIISDSDVPSIISFNFRPIERDTVKRLINDSIANMGLEHVKSMTDSIDYELRLEGYKELAEQLSRSSENVFNVSVTLGIFGETEDEAVENAAIMRNAWRNHDHSVLNIVPEGFLAYEHLLPYCQNNKFTKEFERAIHAKSISRIWPATTDSFSHSKGLFLGVSANGKPIILDVLNDKSRNIAIYGDTGSGKTFDSALIALRLASIGFEVIGIMPDKFPTLPYIHQNLTFKLSRGSASFNPFHIHSTLAVDEDTDEVYQLKAGDYLDDKTNQIAEFLKGILPLEPIQITHLKEAILETYALFGLTYDSTELPSQFPTLQNLSEVLKRHHDLETLGHILIENQYNNIFGEQEWEFGEYPITTFSLEHLPEGTVREVTIGAILQSVWEYVLTKETPIAIYIDETWKLVESESQTKFVRKAAKQIRKRGVARGVSNEGAGLLLTCTQNMYDYLRSPDAQDIHKLSRYKIYLPMSEIDRKALESVSSEPLSREHRDILRDVSSIEGTKKYGQGVMSVGDFATFEINIQATDYEMALINNRG